ncbi:nuclear transport factor 2 family protein [Halieaceae bacterium]|nr:nuclear transport factor 2 family protein [Halieaceae bacterium]
MSELQQLLDKQALYEIACSYCRGVDRMDFKLIDSIYHEQAIHDHGAMFCGVKADFINWLKQSLPGITTQHFVGNALFKFDDASSDRAQGEIYTINYHVMPGNNEGQGNLDYVAGGRYLDEYIRSDGAWKIWRRSRVLDWTHERASSATAVGAGVKTGAEIPNDPSYQLLDLFTKN